MKAKLRDFFERQQYEPWPERLLDLPKSALVLRGFDLDGKTWHGIYDTEELEYVPIIGLKGKAHGKFTREQIGRSPETITAPGSVIKKLREKFLVQLLADQTYESGSYDVFALGGSKRGFKRWDKPDESVLYSPMPEEEAEFANLWVPVRQATRAEIFYLQWKWCFGSPLTNDSRNVQGYGIALLEHNQEAHQQMVSNAY